MKKILFYLFVLCLGIVFPLQAAENKKVEVPKEWTSFVTKLQKEMLSRGISQKTIDKAYKGKNHSLGSSQVLFEDYSFDKAKIVLEEMCESLVLELIEKGLITNCISLYVSYSRILKAKSTGKSISFGFYTNSFEKIKKHLFLLYNQISVSFHNLTHECFLNYSFLDDKSKLKKEVIMHKSIIKVKEKYGKNAILKGISYLKGACAKKRNAQIGGHNE